MGTSCRGPSRDASVHEGQPGTACSQAVALDPPPSHLSSPPWLSHGGLFCVRRVDGLPLPTLDRGGPSRFARRGAAICSIIFGDVKGLVSSWCQGKAALTRQ